MRLSLFPDQRSCGLRQSFGCRNGDVLERRRERNGYVHRAEPLHGRVERPERLVGDQRGDLRGDAVTLMTLVDDDRAPGLLDALDDRLRVERNERARVDDLERDAVAGEQL